MPECGNHIDILTDAQEETLWDIYDKHLIDQYR